MSTAAVFPRQPPYLRPEGAQGGILTPQPRLIRPRLEQPAIAGYIQRKRRPPAFPCAANTEFLAVHACDNDGMEELCRFAIWLFS